MFIDGVGDAPIHNTLLIIITMDLRLEAYPGVREGETIRNFTGLYI